MSTGFDFPDVAGLRDTAGPRGGRTSEAAEPLHSNTRGNETSAFLARLPQAQGECSRESEGMRVRGRNDRPNSHPACTGTSVPAQWGAQPPPPECLFPCDRLTTGSFRQVHYSKELETGPVQSTSNRNKIALQSYGLDRVCNTSKIHFRTTESTVLYRAVVWSLPKEQPLGLQRKHTAVPGM